MALPVLETALWAGTGQAHAAGCSGAWPLSALPMCLTLVSLSRSFLGVIQQARWRLGSQAMAVWAGHEYMGLISEMDFLGSFAKSEVLQNGWKLSVPTTVGIWPPSKENGLCSPSARVMFMTFAASWSAENNSAKCNFKKSNVCTSPEF